MKYEDCLQMLKKYRKNKKNAKKIEQAIGYLGEPEKAICTMFYLERMTAEKIALKMNYDVSTIFRHKRKAVKMLTRILGRG